MFLSETHQGSGPLPAALDDIIAPRAARLRRGWKDRRKGPAVKSPASHATPVPVTPDHMPPCAAKPCHSSFPLGKQRPLSGRSYCDHAEQKQSVPLGCSLWSDPAFSLLQLYWFVQHSTSQADAAVWIFCLNLSVLKRPWRLSGAFPSSVCSYGSVCSEWVLIWEAQVHSMALKNKKNKETL